MWTLAVLIFAITFILAIPLGLYMAQVFEGQCRLPGLSVLDRKPRQHRAAKLEAVLLWRSCCLTS